MVIASAWGPGPAGVDAIWEIVQDWGWKLLASGKQSLRVVRWPRLLERLSGTSVGRPVLDPVSTWDEARRSLLRSATARALAGALIHHHEACSAVWHDLWSVCCGGGCVPFTVGAPAKVLRVRRDNAGLGASVCLCPALWVVPGTRQ